jgi:hypothetical protein
MNRPTTRPRRPGRSGRACGLGGLAVALAAAALALAGCGASPGSASTGGSGSTPAASHSSSPASGSGGGSGGPAFFPVAVGNTWVYKDSLGGTRTDRMTAVTPVAGGQAVTMRSTGTGLGAASTSKSTYIFRSDGSIELPSNELGNGVTISGGGLFWPPAAQLSSGQPDKSTLHVRISENGLHIKETAHITVRGAGTASVTVPAGTYQATVVDMTMTVTADGYPVSIEVRTWVANGVGPVKSEAVLGEGGTSHITAVQELKSFTRG